MAKIGQFTFQSTNWLQQLVADVDVTKLTPEQHWTGTGTPLPNSVGYYPGGPPIAEPNTAWSDGTNKPEVHTPNLLGYNYNIFGSDKARSFTGPDGNLIFLFGDVRGQTSEPYDPIASSQTTDPEADPKAPISLQCWTGTQPSFIPAKPNDPTQPINPDTSYTLLVYPNNSLNNVNPLGLTFQAKDMGADNAPYSGVTIPPYNGTTNPSANAYVVLRFNQLIMPVKQKKPGGTGWASVLTKLNTNQNYRTQADPATSFTYLRVLSQLNFTATKTQGIVEGVPLPAPTTNPCFIQTALHCYDSSYPSYANVNLQGGQGYLLTFGSGTLRSGLVVSHLPLEYITIYDLSSIYLSATPYVGVESGIGTMYFQGHDTQPRWSGPDDTNNPGVNKRCWPVLGGTPDNPAVSEIGDFSVVCLLNRCTEVPELWLMMCDGPSFSGIQLYWSLTPWGPWNPASGLPVFANENGDGNGTWQAGPETASFPNGAPFVQNFLSTGDHRLNGPVIGPENKPQGNNFAPPFKVYGPMIIEKFCKMSRSPGQGGTTQITLTVYWTLCTWIPYYPVLMRSVFTFLVI